VRAGKGVLAERESARRRADKERRCREESEGVKRGVGVGVGVNVKQCQASDTLRAEAGCIRRAWSWAPDVVRACAAVGQPATSSSRGRWGFATGGGCRGDAAQSG
jgi:hypothetical protein